MRAAPGWMRSISFCRRPRARTSSRSAPKNGCATTTTSSRTRFVTSASTCRESTTSSCPSSADGPFEGYPRVYLLARELIAHTAGRIDLETVVDFTSAYQRTAPLTMGEVWAVPIMLRLGLVEELRRLAEGVFGARQSRGEARRWYPRLSSTERWDDRADRAGARERPRPATGAWPRRSSSSCWNGCAISPPPPRRFRRRCIARSKRRTIPPTRCCGSSISARPPTSSRSAT